MKFKQSKKMASRFNKIKIVSSLGLLMFAFNSQASDLTIPNQFTSGTRAVAADVNANFDAAATSVTDNQAQITDLIAQITILTTSLNALASTVDELETSNTSLQLEVDALTTDSVAGLANVLTVGVDNQGNSAAIFSGVNLHVNNGIGNTSSVNALGNLVIGYDEDTTNTSENCSDGIYINVADCESNGEAWAISHKTGSHNLIIGQRHNYSKAGGLLAGSSNNLFANNSSVSGGNRNTTKSPGSSVAGGQNNIVSGDFSSVVGGEDNIASGIGASVTGGNSNRAEGLNSSVLGGFGNAAEAQYSIVIGGLENNAVGEGAAIVGGSNNRAQGENSTITGGSSNLTNGAYSSVSGGDSRTASGAEDWVAGSLTEDN